MERNLKTLLIHNIVAPYRLPLFDEIAKRCDLTVLFCSPKVDGRQWSNNLAQQRFHSKFLRHIKLGFFTLNPGLPFYLLKHPADIYILIDNEENVFSNLCAAWITKLTGKSYVLWSGHIPIDGATIHPIDFHSSLLHRWPIKNLFIRATNYLNGNIYAGAASYLAYSSASKQFLIKRGVNPVNIVVGTQAMSPSLMLAAKEKVRLNTEKLQVLYLGYLRPEKGVKTLINAVLKLPASKVDLHIVGDGPEKNRLQEIVGSATNIKFHPYANTTKRAQWYTSVDVLVLPTFYDPWAHVVTESLYYGTPVIVTNSAAASIVIQQGKNGFVFEAGDIDDLADTLNTLTAQVIITMRKYICQADNSRLYSVDADAVNFMKAIDLALGDE